MSASEHINNQILRPTLVGDSTLHVVVPITNPLRYHSRYRLFRDFAARMEKTPHVQLYVVEAAHGDRHHEVTEAGNPRHLQLRTSHVLWHKENLINIGARALLPTDWRYIAWIDGDVEFMREHWALETLHELQHHHLVQPWSEAAFLGHHGETTDLFHSFASLAGQGVTQAPGDNSKAYRYGHSGFAWAATRQWWEETGGLMDFAILGSADHHMAWASIGKVEASVNGKTTESYKKFCTEWQHRCYRVTQGRLGYVPGTILHHFHGNKALRFYKERWRILVDHKYDPKHDLRRDNQGMIYLTGKPQLSEDIYRYMRSRNEDSI